MDPLRPEAEAAIESWARRVRANREQVDRFREVPDATDFYAPMAQRFRDDPRRTDDPALDLLRSLVRSDETWLDIGAGGGRYALPIALRAREVIALDPSEGMLGVLRESMAEHGIENVRIVHARWPTAEPVRGDVALICHVGYDIEQIGPFLNAMEHAAGRMCVAMLNHRQPTWGIDQLWPAVHGEARSTLPCLPDFLALQLARGRLFELRLVERPPQSWESPDQVLGFGRQQTWVQPDGEKDRRLQSAIAEHLVEREGRYAFSWEPNYLGVVTWTRPVPIEYGQ